MAPEPETRDPMAPAARLDALTTRLAELERAHAHESATLRATNARLSAELASLRAARGGDARRPRWTRGHPTSGGADVPGGAEPRPAGRTSRRGMLGAAAKVAAATVAAGVLVEQVGTRAAYADNLGNFSSSVSGTPAVTATGTNGADGISSSSSSGIGVAGYGGSGTGVYGTSNSGDGVQGAVNSSVKYGVHGINTSNTISGVAVYGHSDNGSGGNGPGTGVYGDSGTGYGVWGISNGGVGVLGQNGAADGVQGTSNTGNGVHGASTSGDGVFAVSGGPAGYGLHAFNTSNVASSAAVLGHSDDGGGGLGPGIGVQGETASGQGVRGTATTGVGVYGTTAGGASTQAMFAVGTTGSTGLRATSDTGNALVALSTNGTGLNVQSATGSAVVATSNGVGYGLYLTAPSGWAIGCVGRLRVLGAAVGTVTLKAGTTSKQVTTTACSGASQVILTATSDPQVRVWAVASPGYFTLHANSAPASDVTFSYFLIN